jgi:hypothetical protein
MHLQRGADDVFLILEILHRTTVYLAVTGTDI